MRGNGLKLCQRVRLGIRKHFFSEKSGDALEHREVVESLSMEVLKGRMEAAQRTVVRAGTG